MQKSFHIMMAICATSLLLLGIFFIREEFYETQYEVEIHKCSGGTDTLNFTTTGGTETIKTYREAVPVLEIGRKRFINVCDYKILKKERK
jgi:hypothetical protein